MINIDNIISYAFQVGIGIWLLWLFFGDAIMSFLHWCRIEWLRAQIRKLSSLSIKACENKEFETMERFNKMAHELEKEIRRLQQ